MFYPPFIRYVLIIAKLLYVCLHVCILIHMYSYSHAHDILALTIVVLAGKLAAEVVAKRAKQEGDHHQSQSEASKGIKAVHTSVLEKASKYTAKDPVGINVNGDPAIIYGGGAIVNAVSETIRELGEIIRPVPEEASMKV